MMRLLFAIPLVLTLTIPLLAQRASSAGSDDAEIRELIARYDRGEVVARTNDVVFWSGVYKYPTIGQEKGEQIPTDRQPSLRVPGSQRTRTTVVRIELSSARDLAYEFSNSTLSFDLKSGTKEEIPTSTLRVWKKEGGQWKIAAMFVRPHYQEPAAAKK